MNPDGTSWYYNSDTGGFVAHIDDDDYIYLITPEEINNASGDDTILSSYRDESKFWGQLALEGSLSESSMCAVVVDLYNRSNTTEDVKLNRNIFFLVITRYCYWPMRLHMQLNKIAGIMSNDKSVCEISADKFVRNHWAYKKASKTVKEIISAHEKQYS